MSLGEWGGCSAPTLKKNQTVLLLSCYQTNTLLWSLSMLVAYTQLEEFADTGKVIALKTFQCCGILHLAMQVSPGFMCTLILICLHVWMSAFRRSSMNFWWHIFLYELYACWILVLIVFILRFCIIMQSCTSVSPLFFAHKHSSTWPASAHESPLVNSSPHQKTGTQHTDLARTDVECDMPYSVDYHIPMWQRSAHGDSVRVILAPIPITCIHATVLNTTLMLTL